MCGLHDPAERREAAQRVERRLCDESAVALADPRMLLEIARHDRVRRAVEAQHHRKQRSEMIDHERCDPDAHVASCTNRAATSGRTRTWSRSSQTSPPAT